MKERAGAAAEAVLRVLEARALVERGNVAAPGVGRPVWAYRITAAGARVVGSRTNRDLAALPAPTAGYGGAAVYLPSGAAAALKALRNALGGSRLNAEWGWKTAAGLRALAGANPDRPEPFGLHDLLWLLRGSLAETRGEGELAVWRATAVGAVVLVLEWREPEPRGSAR